MRKKAEEKMRFQEPGEDARYFAETIISGEYRAFVVALEDDRGIIHWHGDGSFSSTLGLAEILVKGVKRSIVSKGGEHADSE